MLTVGAKLTPSAERSPRGNFFSVQEDGQIVAFSADAVSQPRLPPELLKFPAAGDFPVSRSALEMAAPEPSHGALSQRQGR